MKNNILRLPFALLLLCALTLPVSSIADTLPKPLVHYTFAGSGTTAINSGTGGAAFDQTLAINTRDSLNLPAPTFGAAEGGPFGATPFLDFTGATAMGNGYAPQSYLGNNSASAYQADHAPAAAMTVSGWFWLEDTLPAANQNVTIFRNYINSPKHGWQIIFPGDTGVLRLGMIAATTPRNYDAPAATFSTGTGAWQFFAVTWTSTGGAQWYAGNDTASGAPVAAGVPNTNTFAYDAPAGTTVPLQLGAQSNQASGGAFKGKLADLRIYSTALNAGQISEIHASIKPVTPLPKPFIRWDFSALATGSLANNTRIANTGTGVGLTDSLADFNLRTDAPNADVFPEATADGAGPFENGRALDLSRGAMAGAGVQTKLVTSQTAAGNFSEMTVTGWINPSADLASGATLFRNANASQGWQIAAINARQLRLSVYDGATDGGNLNTSGTMLATGTGAWQFIAVTWRSGTGAGSGAQWFVGDEQNAPRLDYTAIQTKGTGAMSQAAPYDLKLGCGGSSGAFKGLFADVRIYDTALDTDQIAAVYDGAKPPPPPEPLVRYTFDDDAPAGDTAPAALTNDGSLGADYNIAASGIGAAARITNDGSGAFGTGRALDLTSNPMNGTADAFGTTAARASLSGLNALSVSFWLKVPELWTGSGVYVFRNNSGYDGWRITTNSNGRLVLTVGNGSANRDFGSSNNLLTAADAGKWKFITVVWDNAATGSKWYVGDEQNEPALAPAVTAVAEQTMSASAQQLNLGRAGTGTTGSLKALLDEVRIYDIALTAKQVLDVYDGQKPDTPILPPPSIVSFTPTAVSVGGTMTIMGSNFTDSGTSVVTDVQIGEISAGANFIVDSGTQISVSVIPSDIPASGYVSILASTGTAVSSGTYSIATEPSTPTTPTIPSGSSEGGDITLTASASGNPAPIYTWQYSDDGGLTWKAISELGAANYELSVDGSSLTLKSVPGTMVGYQFKYTADNGIGTPATSDPVTIAFSTGSPVITGFAPTEISVGGTVTITGSNFMDSGTSVMTDVLFGTVATGASNFAVDSGTQITVSAVPAGIPDSDFITVIATTGSAVSSGTYTLAASGSVTLPNPLLHYKFATPGTTLINDGSLESAFDIPLIGTGSIGADGSGVGGVGRMLDLSTNTTINGAAVAYAEDTANKTGLTGLDAMTISGWFNPSISWNTGGAMVFRNSGNGSTNDGWYLQTNSSNRLALVIGGTASDNTAKRITYNSSSFADTTNAWQFFTVTWDKNNGATWYAGDEFTEPVQSRPSGSDVAHNLSAVAQTLRIGRSNTTSGAVPGRLADLRIYNQALTAAQVKEIRKQALPDTPILPPPSIVSFTPTAVSVGGTMTIMGSNFTDSGTSVVTDVQIGEISAGANFIIDSGSQISVSVIPSGIPASGYVSVLASTGTAVSSSAYAIATAPSAPVAPTVPHGASEGGDIIFTASASGNPAPVYTWEYSDDGGITWKSVSTLDPSSYELSVDGSSFTLKAVSAAMLGYQFRYTADNGIGTPATSDPVTLVFPPPPPVITGFTPSELAIGGALEITGSNFIISGTTLVTDVIIGDMPAGSGNYTVNSGTQITVGAVPLGILDTGYITVVATSGSAVSPTPYTVSAQANPNGLPAPFVHYKFTDLVSGSIPTNTFTANSGTGVGTTGTTADYNLKIQTATSGTAFVYASSGTAGSGPFDGGRSLDLSRSTSMNGTAPPVLFNTSQTGLSNCETMTITGWVNPSEDIVNGSYIMRDSAWRFYFSGPQRMALQVYNSSNSYVAYQSAANAYKAGPDRWQFFAVSWSGTDAQWYAGDEANLPAAGTLASGTVQMGPPSTLTNTLGRFNSNSGAFKGKFADIRIYKTKLDATQITAVYDDAIAATGVQPPPRITGFSPTTVTSGSAMIITGLNFVSNGTSVVNDVIFENVSTGSASFVVNSGTQITVTAVPSLIPLSGYIRVLASSGTAVSSTMYALDGGEAALPLPPTWEDDSDSRRLAARTAYLHLLDRGIAAQPYHVTRINKALADTTSLGRGSLYYAYGLVYRASLHDPADLTIAARQTRLDYISYGRDAVYAMVNTVANGTTDERNAQVTEFQFCLGSLIRLYNMLVTLDAFTPAEQTDILAKLADCSQALYDGTPKYHLEYGAFNRGATAADGMAAAAALFPSDPRSANWLQYANAVWADWIRNIGAANAHADTFEDARGYNGLWIFATFNHADGLGAPYLAQMKDAKVADMLGRFAHMSAHNGMMPDFGNAYWDHGLAFWLYSAERLGQLYGRADFLENAQRLADFITRQPPLALESLEAVAGALASVDATPSTEVVVRPDAIATERVTDFGVTLHDKLYLRTGNESGSAFAAFDLHDHGYHGHEDSAALGLYTVGSSVLLHSQGRENTFANQEQSVWAVRAGEDILANSDRHAPNESTCWLVNHRFPGTYTGGPVLDISKVKNMFFRAQNKSASPITLSVVVESVTGVKHDGTEVQVSGSWVYNGTVSGSSAAFVNSTNFSPTLDLSSYDYMLVKWKSSHPDYTEQFGFNGDSFMPTGAADGRGATATLRTTAGAHVLDAYAEENDIAPKGGVTRIMLDSAGRQIVHDRDVRLRKADGALLVLDTFEFIESGDYTVGPVWHVENIVNQGANYVITRDDAQQYYYDKYGNITDTIAETPTPLRFDFAVSGSTNAVELVNKTYASDKHPQKEHFAASVTGARAAGEKVSVLSVLRSGVPGTTGAAVSHVPTAPALMSVGEHYANYADTVSQVAVGEAPPPPPVILSFSPTALNPGGVVIIKGFGFADSETGEWLVEKVTIGGVSVGSTAWGVNNASQMSIVTVPYTIPETGYIEITTKGGVAVSAEPYTIAMPQISSFSPAAFYQDGAVVINGANLLNVREVTIGGVRAVSWSGNSAGTALTVILPAGIPDTGYITITTANGSVTTDTAYNINSTPLGQPYAVAVDGSRNVYIADYERHAIKKITPSGDISTFAGQPGAYGSNSGYGTGARFRQPAGITLAGDGNLYVSDMRNGTVRKITPGAITSQLAGNISGTTWVAGEPTTWVDGQGSAAWMNYPMGIASDSLGNLYVADSLNHTIRKVTLDGMVTTIAGTPMQSGTSDGIAFDPVTTGTEPLASFNTPKGVAVYEGDAGIYVYVADSNNHAIRAITPGGYVVTIAGAVGQSGNVNGTGTAARFNSPMGMVVDADGFIYLADYGSHTIREIDIVSGSVGTYAGALGSYGLVDGDRLTARFRNPADVAFDNDGRLYVADAGNRAIRIIELDDTVNSLGVSGSSSTNPLPPIPNEGPKGNAENSGGGAPSPWLLAALAALAAFRLRKRFTALLAVAFLISTLQPFSPSAFSQQTATGSIQGQVLNIDSGDYINQARVRVQSVNGVPSVARIDALTDDQGRYWLVNVPAGKIVIEASFTGIASRILTVDLEPGQNVVAETIQMSLASAGGDDIVQLDRFVVESKRDLTGAAIAINSQRYADNTRSVMSVDEMGFVGDGGIASALKFLPGVDLENDDQGFGNAITLSGAPSANVPVTIGGFDAVTSSDLVQNASGAANQRSVNLMQLSLNSISRVEINRSPTPDSPGSALAGSVNLVPKSAFERARPLYKVQIFGTANQESISLSRYSAPMNGKKVPIQAGATFTAIVPMSKRFGFSLTLNHSVTPKSYGYTGRNVSANWNSDTGEFLNTPNNTSHYMAYDFDLQDVNSIYTRDSINLTADIKLTRNDTISITYNQSYNELESGQRRAYWGLGRALLDLNNSTDTSVQNAPTPGATGTEIRNDTVYNDFVDKNRQFQFKYRHRGRDWNAELGASYGDAGREAVNFARDLLFSAPIYVQGTTIRFTDYQKWNIGNIEAYSNGIPVSPLDLNSIAALGGVSRTIRGIDGLTNVVTSMPDMRVKPYETSDRKVQLNGSMSRNFFIGDTTHTVKLGFDYSDYKREQFYDSKYGTSAGYVYNGTDLSMLDYINTDYNRELPKGYGVLTSLDLRKLALFYKENQNSLIPVNEGNDYQTAVINDRYIREKITSAYLRFDSSFFNRRLSVVYGVRFERTEDEGEGPLVNIGANRQWDPVTQTWSYIHNKDSLAAKQLTYTRRGNRAKNSYNDWFPSVNMNYLIRENLIARISYSQTIGRPDIYNIVPGVVSQSDPAVDGTGKIILTNPDLKPWKSQNVSLSLELYSSDVGDITLRAYRRWVDNAFADQNLSFKEAMDMLARFGVDNAEYMNAVVQMPRQIPGTVVTSGLELSGRYSLDKILPVWARGFQVKFSVTRSTITGGDEAAAAFGAQKLYLFPWSVGGNIQFARKYYSISLNGKWNDTQRRAYWSPVTSTWTLGGDTIAVYEPGTYEYLYKSFRLDLDITIRLTKNLSFFLNGRDITGWTQEYHRYGPNTPNVLKYWKQSKYEAVWTAGMTATF